MDGAQELDVPAEVIPSSLEESKLPKVPDKDTSDEEVGSTNSTVTKPAAGRSSGYNLRTSVTAPARLML